MKTRRLCFVVSDLLGLVTNSGIGTATAFMAIVLAEAGHDVTVVHTRGDRRLERAWEDRYRLAGVKVRAAPASIVAPAYVGPTYQVFEHVRHDDFDSIVFQDWLALGWASMQAKRTGLAFQRTQLVHICHGPDAWLHEANCQVAVDVEALALAHMGRTSAELADTLVGPSRYLLEWMESAGWKLPERRFVVPYFTEGHVDAIQGRRAWDRPATMARTPLREIAFFGRLERRKGVQIFTAALNELDPSLLEGIRISFLGREATYRTSDVRAMLAGPLRRASAGVDFFTELDHEGACNHLARPGTMAVIASLTDNSPNTIYECIERAIPFIATTTGGTPELLHDADRNRCLVAPEPLAMADGLRRLLQEGLTPEPARAAFDGRESLRLWNEILDWKPSERIEVRESPLVTAVITHHDRPALVITAVEAVDAQDYAPLEVVVVDDGSQYPDSHRVLDEIAGHAWRHHLKVVRQENQYLGAARNAGVRAGRGELIVFVDDDDVPMPHFVSTLVTAHLATGADAVTCAMRAFSKPAGPPGPADDRGTWVFLGGPLHLALVENCMGGAPALLRRSALDAIGGYHEMHGVGFEDWQLYVRLLFAGRTVVSVPEAIYWYRIQERSMRSTMSDYKSAQVVIKEFRDALPPGLRSLADLAHGQAAVMKQRVLELLDDLDLRERSQWLAEEQLARATGAPAVITIDERNIAEGSGRLRERLMAFQHRITAMVQAASERRPS